MPDESGGRAWQALRSSMTAENVVDAARFGIVAGIIAYSACLMAAPRFVAGETDSLVQHVLGALGVLNIVLWVIGIASWFGGAVDGEALYREVRFIGSA